MPRPNKVKVGPFTYSIYWTQAKWDEYSEYASETLKGAGGACFPALLSIVVNADNLAVTVQKNVLIHELLHACFDLTQYGESKLPKDFEEHTVRALTPALHQLLQDNPKLVEWLISND